VELLGGLREAWPGGKRESGDVAVEGPSSVGGLGSPAGFFAFPPSRTLKRGTEGSMYDSCNLTGHVMRET